MKQIQQLILTMLLLSMSMAAFSSGPGVYYDCDISPSMTELGEDFEKTDLEGKKSLKILFQTSSVEYVEALAKVWKELKDKPYTRRAVEVLKTTVKHLREAPFKNNADLTRDYMDAVKEYTGSISTKTGYGHPDYEKLPELYTDYFNELFKYTEKFKGKPSFTLPAYPNQTTSQDGFYLTMRYLNSNRVSASNVVALDLTFEVDGGMCPDCLFDVKLSDGEYIEFKSYKQPSKIPLNQFTAYLSRIETLGQLKYIFNAKKVTETQARNGMKTFINANKQAVFDGMSAGLRAELFSDVPVDELSGLSVDDFTNTEIETLVNNIVEVY